MIDSNETVLAFFETRVREAARARGADPDAPTALYVAGLLAGYAQPGALSKAALDRPLSLQLRDALDTVGPARFERLRGLGDHALYVSGFFAESLERRGVERRFVQDLGRTAYDAASAMLRRAAGENRGPHVFDELATHFADLVKLLEDVADALYATSATSPKSVLDVYERWSRRGTPALAQALAGWGIVPLRGSGTLH
ncbi:MAG TPA: hypothetical protein VHE30_22075 [Polyangiaceae bacterium]|nr:hypothetical protein [Polyangiaceae bacterium]